MPAYSWNLANSSHKRITEAQLPSLSLKATDMLAVMSLQQGVLLKTQIFFSNSWMPPRLTNMITSSCIGRPSNNISVTFGTLQAVNVHKGMLARPYLPGFDHSCGHSCMVYLQELRGLK